MVVVFVEMGDGQNLSYRGFRISITIPSSKNNSVVTVKRGSKTLARHAQGIPQAYGSHAELVSLLGLKTKQLVISQYTGGNHCCNLYWIYQLTPSFRLLFRSTDFSTVGYSEIRELFENLDSDADLEIIDNSSVFHYFDDLPFVSSPTPTLIFDYNKRTRRFELANRRFADYLLKDHPAWVARTKEAFGTDRRQYSVNTFAIFLALVYAGRESTAWKYYHTEKAKAQSGFHSDNAIRRTLNADPAYRWIYKK